MSIFPRGSVRVVLMSVRFFLKSLDRAPRVDAQASDERTGIEGWPVWVSMVFQTDGYHRGRPTSSLIKSGTASS